MFIQKRRKLQWKKRKKFWRSIILSGGGILFALLALMKIPAFINSIRASMVYEYYPITYSISALLFIIGSILISISLFMKRRDIIACIGLAIITLNSIISFLNPNNFFSKLFILIYIAGYVLILLFALSQFTNYLVQFKETSKKFWFVPIICIGIVSLIDVIGAIFIGRGGTVLLQRVVEVGAVVLTIIWIVFPDGIPSKEATFSYNTKTSYDGVEYTMSALPGEAYCSMVKHVLLLLFTFGIWYLIWIYKVTGYLNAVKDEEPREPATKLLLCMFIPFYVLYWTYKSAQRIDKLAKQKGLSADSATLCLIMAIFLPIIAPILMQDKMNNIITAKKESAAHQQGEVNIGAASELKNYKELLDSGVITQEEFEEKKKQLLSL